MPWFAPLPPSLRLRVGDGRIVLLLRPRPAPARRRGACVLAFVVGPRVPFLRRLALYRGFAGPARPDGTRRAA